MKRLLFMFMCAVAALTANAQDVIVKKDGNTILAKVVRVTTTEVKYKDYTVPNGPTHAISIANLMGINYEDGERITFGTEEAQTKEAKPALKTNETATQYSNDIELERKWNEMKTPYEMKAKKWRVAGFISGGVLLGSAAVAAVILNSTGDILMTESGFVPVSLAAAGLIAGTTCLLKSHNYSRKAKRYVAATPLWENNIDLGKGKNLAIGVDAINDNFSHSKTLGLGVRLNF